MSGFSEVRIFLSSLFEDDAGVVQPEPGAARFGSRGFRVDGKVFAMEADGALAVKLPAGRVRSLVAQERGAALTMGGRSMKEWIVVGDRSIWRDIAREARDFAGSIGTLRDRG